MSARIIDSSVGISWVYHSQATPLTVRLLADVEAGEATIVPRLWFTEVANSLLVLERRKKISSKDRRLALATLEDLNLEVDEESERAAFHDTSVLAEANNLTVYDATYLEAAIRRKAAIGSRDEALCAAARRCGVSVL